MTQGKLDKLRDKVFESGNPKLYVPLSEEYKKLGMTADAIHVLESCIEQFPKYMSARAALGNLYMEKGCFIHAIEEFAVLAGEIPNNVLTHRKLAKLYAAIEDPQKALSSYETVLSLNPADDDALTNIQKIINEIQATKEQAQQEAIQEAALEFEIDDSDAAALYNPVSEHELPPDIDVDDEQGEATLEITDQQQSTESLASEIAQASEETQSELANVSADTHSDEYELLPNEGIEDEEETTEIIETIEAQNVIESVMAVEADFQTGDGIVDDIEIDAKTDDMELDHFILLGVAEDEDTEVIVLDVKSTADEAIHAHSGSVSETAPDFGMEEGLPTPPYNPVDEPDQGDVDIVGEIPPSVEIIPADTMKRLAMLASAPAIYNPADEYELPPDIDIIDAIPSDTEHAVEEIPPSIMPVEIEPEMTAALPQEDAVPQSLLHPVVEYELISEASEEGIEKPKAEPATAALTPDMFIPVAMETIIEPSEPAKIEKQTTTGFDHIPVEDEPDIGKAIDGKAEPDYETVITSTVTPLITEAVPAALPEKAQIATAQPEPAREIKSKLIDDTDKPSTQQPRIIKNKTSKRVKGKAKPVAADLTPDVPIPVAMETFIEQSEPAKIEKQTTTGFDHIPVEDEPKRQLEDGPDIGQAIDGKAEPDYETAITSTVTPLVTEPVPVALPEKAQIATAQSEPAGEIMSKILENKTSKRVKGKAKPVAADLTPDVPIPVEMETIIEPSEPAKFEKQTTVGFDHIPVEDEPKRQLEDGPDIGQAIDDIAEHDYETAITSTATPLVTEPVPAPSPEKTEVAIPKSEPVSKIKTELTEDADKPFTQQTKIIENKISTRVKGKVKAETIDSNRLWLMQELDMIDSYIITEHYLAAIKALQGLLERYPGDEEILKRLGDIRHVAKLMDRDDNSMIRRLSHIKNKLRERKK